MYDIEHLSTRLARTKDQLRHRVKLLGKTLEPYKRSGKKGKLLLTEDGVAILERLIQLEDQGIAMSDAIEIIRQELDGDEPQSSPPEQCQSGTIQELIWHLKQENEFLKDQIRSKDEQIAQLNKRLAELGQLLQQRLPPTREEIREKRWWRFWRR